MADSVRVSLDRLVLDALGDQALQECVESGDGEGDPARTRPPRVRLDEERGVLVDIPEDLFSGAQVRGRPKNRVYQSIAAPSSGTGTPAMRWVIAPCNASPSSSTRTGNVSHSPPGRPMR